MTTPLRHRFIVFCAAIAGLLALVGWSAFTAWSELGTLRRQLTTAEFQSFRIAGELQSNMLGVNSALLAYAFSGASGDWPRFQKDSDALNSWIDLQRDVLKTAEEKRVLAAIDAEYDRYLAVAQTIRQERSERTIPPTTRLDAAARRMLVLAEHLAEAHRAALGDLLGESQRSLRKLEALFGAGFVLIMAVGAWGGRIFFYETIAPLRRQLIETQALAERHEKLASLGVLAAGVAHEIRNPLTAIKLRTHLLRQNLNEGAPADEDVTLIECEINRLERIVSDFLVFAHPGDPQLAPLAARDLFQETSALLAPELADYAIELRVERGADDTLLRADAHQLKQVLINLVRNAAESIGQKGTITLRTRTDRLPLEGRLTDVIVLEVQDTGIGIPADVQKRLFDPFFTTKAAGTGLGLSIAMSILERHGGTLQFQTVPGRGTTFGVVLPIPSTDLRPADIRESAAPIAA